MGCCIANPELLNSSQANQDAQMYRSPHSVKKSTIDRAESYRVKGNNYFSHGQYQNALSQYRKAIKQNPNDVKLYTNLSVCYRKMQNWDQVYDSSKKALLQDNSSKKALLLHAISLAQLSKTSQNQKKIAQIDEAQSILLRLSSDSQFREQSLSYLSKLSELRKAYKTQILCKTDQQFSNYIRKRVKESKMSEELQSFYSSHQQMVDQICGYLENFLSEQIPQFFQDPINFQIFQKPMISQTGLTYEANILSEHFRSHGNMDPITKEAIEPSCLVENKNLIKLINSHRQITKWKIQQRSQNPQFIRF